MKNREFKKMLVATMVGTMTMSMADAKISQIVNPQKPIPQQ